VYVQLNQGGSLGPAVFYDTLRNAALIVPADLDRDGDLDLVVQCDGYYRGVTVESGISLLENLGDGTLAAPRNFLTGFNYWMQSVAVADFSGDGLPDLVVGGFQNAQARTNYLVNQGNLSFSAPAAILQRNSEYLASGDLDADGDPELLVQKPFPEQDLVEIYAVSGGSFTLQGVLDGQGYALQQLALGDSSGDGLPDVAYLGTFSSRSQVLLFESLGGLQFSAATALPTDGFASAVRLLPLDDDCAPELLTTNAFTASLSAYDNLGGTFAAPRTLLATHRPFAAAVTDFDGDGVPELVVALDDNDLDPTTSEIGIFRFCGGLVPPVAPFVASVTPARGKYDASTPVSIQGSGFAPASTVRVFFGDQEAASVTVIDPQTLAAVTPAGVPGPVSVEVQSCAGEDALVRGFAYTPAILLAGDFSLGGTFTRTYLNEPGDNLFALLGLPPVQSIPTPPYDGALCILPFFREFLLVGYPADHLTQALTIPGDPILAGVQVLFQALIGPDFQGADRSGSWTNCAVLSIVP